MSYTLICFCPLYRSIFSFKPEKPTEKAEEKSEKPPEQEKKEKEEGDKEKKVDGPAKSDATNQTNTTQVRRVVL